MFVLFTPAIEGYSDHCSCFNSGENGSYISDSGRDLIVINVLTMVIPIIELRMIWFQYIVTMLVEILVVAMVEVIATFIVFVGCTNSDVLIAGNWLRYWCWRGSCNLEYTVVETVAVNVVAVVVLWEKGRKYDDEWLKNILLKWLYSNMICIIAIAKTITYFHNHAKQRNKMKIKFHWTLIISTFKGMLIIKKSL